MATFELTNVKIATVTKEGDNKGKKYLVADLINLNCPWETAQRYTSFVEAIVTMCTPCVAVADGGTSAEATKLPPMLQKITGCFADYTPAQKFYKEHLSDHAEQGIKRGDLVKKGGVPILYTSVRIFCQTYKDEDGKVQFMKGASPEEAGQRAFSAYCRPATEERIASIATPNASDAKPKTAAEAAAEQSLPAAPPAFEYVFDEHGSPKLMPS